MAFKDFIKEQSDQVFTESVNSVKLTDELKADISKELHNGHFGAEHRHAIKIKKISDDKYYVLVGHHVDEHQVAMSNIEGLKVGDEIFEIFELDSIELHDIGIVDIVSEPDKSGIFIKKSEAEKYFNSLDK